MVISKKEDLPFNNKTSRVKVVLMRGYMIIAKKEKRTVDMLKWYIDIITGESSVEALHDLEYEYRDLYPMNFYLVYTAWYMPDKAKTLIESLKTLIQPLRDSIKEQESYYELIKSASTPELDKELDSPNTDWKIEKSLDSEKYFFIKRNDYEEEGLLVVDLTDKGYDIAH